MLSKESSSLIYMIKSTWYVWGSPSVRCEFNKIKSLNCLQVCLGCKTNQFRLLSPSPFKIHVWCHQPMEIQDQSGVRHVLSLSLLSHSSTLQTSDSVFQFSKTVTFISSYNNQLLTVAPYVADRRTFFISSHLFTSLLKAGQQITVFHSISDYFIRSAFLFPMSVLTRFLYQFRETTESASFYEINLDVSCLKYFALFLNE